MIDAEVIRLRRLRNKALQVRALAAALDSNEPQRRSLYSRGAVSCWRIACIVTGRLRAHPYMAYQQGPSQTRAAADAASAWAGAAVARYRRRPLQAYLQALQVAASQLDDARALTWSGELSDAFGRLQRQLRTLIDEVEPGARQEAGAQWPAARVQVRLSKHAEARSTMVGRDAAGPFAGNWPYLGLTAQQ
jgi:methyl-accepting chemotaxis protein